MEGNVGGIFEESSGRVLALGHGDIVVPIDLEHEDYIYQNGGQQWCRGQGKMDTKGYFTLRHSLSGRFLVAESTFWTTTTGNRDKKDLEKVRTQIDKLAPHKLDWRCIGQPKLLEPLIKDLKPCE